MRRWAAMESQPKVWQEEEGEGDQIAPLVRVWRGPGHPAQPPQGPCIRTGSPWQHHLPPVHTDADHLGPWLEFPLPPLMCLGCARKMQTDFSRSAN